LGRNKKKNPRAMSKKKKRGEKKRGRNDRMSQKKWAGTEQKKGRKKTKAIFGAA